MAKSSSPANNADDNLKSKTQLKNEAHELQALGLSLTKLNIQQQQKLPLSEEIYDALRLAEKIKNKHEAFRRHIHFIGKMMRDTNHQEIQAALDAMFNKHGEQDAMIKQYEELRTELLANGDSQIQLLVSENPQLDRQKLRQLIRQANKELRLQKLAQENDEQQNGSNDSISDAAATNSKQVSTKNYKALYSYLKQHVKL